jgi:hypothetical protein
LRILAFVLAAIFGSAIYASVRAEEPFYLGVWKIESGVRAPWVDPPQQPDEKAMKALRGKTVTLRPHAITGPKAFACKGPQYKISEFSADMLFQGQFGEMHATNPAKDPLELAHSLRFRGTSFTTLETGCEIDWHFVDRATAEIALNNYIYVLSKQ